MKDKTQQKRFFLCHKKSSAFAVSVLIHALLAVVAVTFVAVRVYIKPDPGFVGTDVSRPQMKLRKLQVPVKNQKKTQAPKLRQNIIAKPTLKNVTITMPEIVGVPGGMGAGAGGGLGSPGFEFDMDVFGSNRRGKGDEFVGRFYDLKQTKNGELSEIGKLFNAANGEWDDPHFQESRRLYRAAVARFINGWNAGRLDDYFMAPREKYASSFMIPQIRADEAPKAFGVQDQVQPMEWVAWYRGQITAPESGKYRFVGRADDIMVVRVKKDIVIDASFGMLGDWQSSDPENEKYQSYDGGKGCVIGDWFYLQKGKPVPMEVLIGEEPGGYFFCQLYIQKQGVKYPVSLETFVNPDTKEPSSIERPILPIFKMAEIPDKVLSQMEINSSWARADGPSFGSVSVDGRR
ncbi:MAG: hypothetical protein JXR25_02700 [Pontiellaceae bacterium]|nr:hypothetical protein [Pontiellaceae bacterium]MBN2783712.1 hypothetical protein [Pontiellaceae bacterium]